MQARKEPSQEPTLKCVLVGDGGTGKTTFLARHLTGEFRKQYVTTFGAEIHAIVFHTSSGGIRFCVWDVESQAPSSALRDVYYKEAQCAIVIFDVTSRVTYKNVPLWIRDLERVCPRIPIVVCGNKVDLKDRKVKAKSGTSLCNERQMYYDISAKTQHNIEKPFQWIAGQVFGDHKLTFVSTPAFPPPYTTIEDNWQRKMDTDIDEASKTPLPVDDDDDI